MTPQPGSMYLVLPVPFRMLDGELHVELQAANGLDRWADNFAHVTVAAPLIPEHLAATLDGARWRSIATLEHRTRIDFQPLPWAYTPRAFLRAYRSTRKQIAAKIANAEHLQFAIGGLLGDWAAVAAREAIRLKRRFAIHTDRVEHEVMRRTGARTSLPRRARIAVEAPLMKRYHSSLIRRCTLGLWHGEECFRAYAPWCAESHLIHDIHTRASDAITPEALSRKLTEALTATPLRLIYAGRLDPMKAPLEWLQALAHARALGTRFNAVWYGEGPLLAAAQAEAERLQLTAHVTFAGFIADRATLLDHIRQAHTLVFTHITPESPRNLLESLVCGTPILGYDTPFPANLLEQHGGGALVPLHDTQALGRLIHTIANDRAELTNMIQQAAQNGRRFNDTAVFHERSELIRRFA